MAEAFQQGGVRGFLHRPESGSMADAVVLAHGAGSNANAPILIKACEALSAAGFACLRIDLPFRQARPGGPPHPSFAARDQAGIAEAVAVMRELGAKRIVLGGHSYGGRQASMLAAARPELADLLLLFSYPLHPPDKPEALRTSHFSPLRVPAIFVHGTQDPFGSIAEMGLALKNLPLPPTLLEIAKGGHDLRRVDWELVCGEVRSRLGSSR
jgi:uncharacterized protein